MWIETLLTIETAVAFWLSVFNAASLLKLAAGSSPRARRLASRVLAALCGSQAVESVLFLGSLASGSPLGGWHGLGLLLVRTSLLGSMAGLSLLLWRSRPAR